MERVEAVVIGAGPNGLAAAIVLARAGVRPLVLEAEDEVGGAARSGVLDVPGVIHDLGASVLPLAAGSPVLQRWPLARHGLRWLHAPAPLAHPLSGRPAAWLDRDLHASVERFGKDGPAWQALFGPVAQAFDASAAAALRPLLPPRPTSLMEAWALARFGVRALPPASWWAAAFRDEPARATWAGLAAHAGLPLNLAGSAANGALLGAAAHAVGWPFPQGGAGALMRALQRYLEELGGEVRTGVRVARLAELPSARAVLATVPPATLLRLVDGPVPTGYRRAIQRFRPGSSVVKLDLALTGGLPWRDPACLQAGTVHLGGTYEQIAAALQAVAQGRVPEQAFVIVTQPSRFDPSRRAAAVEPVWAYAHLSPALRDDPEAIRATAARVREALDRAAPAWRDRLVAERVSGPLALQRWNASLVMGDISAGAATLRQLLARPVASPQPYRTPFAGVYLAGASTPPGPGVHGICGALAAQVALRERFGIRRAQRDL